MLNNNFWKGKKVFLTGHTGFKGSWTVLWLLSLGANVKGYSLEPITNPSLFNIANIEDGIESEIGDIEDLKKLRKSISDFSPEIVIHMAAQPLVRVSYQDPIGTYKTNVIGTLNLFEAVRSCNSIRVVLNVTTDKCYENKEWEWGYREDEPMGGHDPYSSSKACSELLTSAYRRSFFSHEGKVSIASARAGNVIGGGDWSMDRLIPDAISAFSSEKQLMIRNPMATRPWQHVFEPISGYLLLCEKLYEEGSSFAEGWNFGPHYDDIKTVKEVIEYIISKWPNKATWKYDDIEHLHEAQLLHLDISKAQSRLGWRPTWNLDKALDNIISWHEAFLSGKDIRSFSNKQILNFQDDIKFERK